MLFSDLECLELVIIITRVISSLFLLESLLSLDFVNDLVKELLRVVDCAGIVSSIAKLFVPLGLQVNKLVE